MNRLLALRFLTICCLLLLAPVILWSPVMGMVALGVTLHWMGSIGTRSADAWASARGNGSSPGRAAAVAGWPQSLALVVAAAAVSIGLAEVVRRLTWVGDWLAGPGVAKPVTAFVLLVLSGIPAMVVVRRIGLTVVDDADGVVNLDESDDEPRSTLLVVTIVAAVLSVVNVVVLANLTPVSDWLGSGGPLQAVAYLVLAIAFVAPPLAAWVMRRR